MKLLILLFFLALFTFKTHSQEVTAPPSSEVARLNLDPFYTQYISANGLPIVASDQVSPYALKEAAYLIEQMLGDRQDVIDAINHFNIRVAIMAVDELTTDIPEHSHLTPAAYWDKRARGLGSTPEAPAVSAGEENLLGYRGDPYSTESIFIHELAHTIHLQGMAVVDATFQERLEKTFARAKLEGLWKGKYAGTNPAEYWAEGVQSWFDTNQENDHEHNHVDTREELKEYDPRLASLVAEAFGDKPWRYAIPPQRGANPHLAGYDPAQAPTFAWPAAVVAAYEAHQRGDHLKTLPSLGTNIDGLKTPSVPTNEVKLRFENQSGVPIRLQWIDFQGNLQPYAELDPGRNTEQSTFGGHLWVATTVSGQVLGTWAAGGEAGLVVVK